MPLVSSNPSDNIISSNTANVKVDQLLSSIINYIQAQPFKGFDYAEGIEIFSVVLYYNRV